VTSRRVEVGEFTEEQLRVQRAGEALHRDGASPAGALELLASITEDRTWERLADAKGRSFKGRFRDFVETRSPFGLGYDPDQLPKVLALQHPHESVPDIAYRMAAMREQVRTLLLAEIPITPAHGEIGRGRDRESATHSKKRDAAAITARLKRDDPELAEKVVSGEVTPNAAAREKGWRKPRIVLSTPERVAASLRKWMPREALSRLAELLTQEESDTGQPEAATGDD
jgi:hypothetical protein